jgi:hypothetical protein
MGLDMYLRADIYVSGYEFSSEKDVYVKLVEALGVGDLVDPETPSMTVKPTVAYWRKANAIHAWFVQHVQNDVDDCGNYEVSQDQLVELRDLCQAVIEGSKLGVGTVVNGHTLTADGWKPNNEVGKVIENPEVAQELLPTTSGFFFGSTGYDEWYYRDLEETVAQIDRVLAAADKLAESGRDVYYEYHSSW